MSQIKSVSDLNSINEIDNKDLLYISKIIDEGKYGSKNITFEKFSENTNKKAYDYTKEHLHISSDQNVQITINTANDILSSMTFDKTNKDRTIVEFTNPPRSNEQTEYDDEIPNRGEIKELISNSPSFISNSSYIICDPDNDNGHTVFDRKLYQWHIDDNGKDSSEFIDQITRRPSGPVTINESGYLTVYGWLASGPNMKPAQAWVGLYAQINTPNGQKWVLVQVQPWIIGANSNVMQYVGFNIPVSMGTRLKIKTGFNVNGNTSGFEITDGLTFNGEGSMPNTFTGYVIQK